MSPALTAAEVIGHLRLSPHPEGGWYRQTWIADTHDGGRPTGTAILYLLDAGTRSHWHRVDAVEIWHWHAGAPLLLRTAASDRGPDRRHTLGPDLGAGQWPQRIVPAHHWQDACPLPNPGGAGWTLVGCTVSPGFRFQGFTLAPPGFDIPG